MVLVEDNLELAEYTEHSWLAVVLGKRIDSINSVTDQVDSLVDMLDTDCNSWHSIVGRCCLAAMHEEQRGLRIVALEEAGRQ